MRKLTTKQRRIVEYVEAMGRPVGMAELHRLLYPNKARAGSVPGNVECIVKKGALVMVEGGGPRDGMAVDIPDRAEDFLGEEWYPRPYYFRDGSNGGTFYRRRWRR